MEIIYTVKTMEEIIGYWVEAEHIASELDNLCEYIDEAAELYDATEWLKNAPRRGEASMMSLGVSVEDASFQAGDIRKDAEDKLRSVLDSAITAGGDRFVKYQGKNHHEKMDDVMEGLYDAFDEIYEYNQEAQIENFYRVLEMVLDEVLN